MVSWPGLVDPLGLWRRAGRAGSRGVSAAGGAAATAMIAGLDRALASARATEVVDVVMRSAAAQHAVRSAAASPLVDAAVSIAIRDGLVERVADQLLDGGVIDHVADRVLAGPELDRVVTTALDSPRMPVLAAEVVDSEGAERLVAQVLESDRTDRLVAQVLDSRLVETCVAHLLARDELWVLVEQVARSPAVTEAIGHQGAGLADQVAGEVGRRSRRADARLERAARQLLRRPPRPGEPAGDTPAPRIG